MLMPGLGEDMPSLEMCMKRTSALQLNFRLRICIPSAPPVVKFTREVPGGDLAVCKQCAAGQFEVGHGPAVRIEVPFQHDRIDAGAVGNALWLKHPENGDRVNGIFESAA